MGKLNSYNDRIHLSGLWFVCSLSLLMASNAFAQNQYTGIVNDNTVSSFLASYNPSSIVDSKTKFSVSTHANYSKISNFSSNNFLIYGGGIKYIEPRNAGYMRKLLNFDALNIKYEFDHKNAAAYSFRYRTLKNMEGVPLDWANNAAKKYDDNLFGTQQNMEGLGLNSLSFTEHNLTYARTIFDRSTSFLKAGISVKILNGTDASYFQVRSGQYKFIDSISPPAELTTIDATLGSSKNNDQLFYKHRGLGFDLGVTYEYRPDFENQYYEMDGVKRNVRYDINKYKWKVSASFTDLGFVRFMSDSAAYYDFTNTLATANANKLVNVTSLNLTSLFQSPIEYVKDSLASTGTTVPGEKLAKFRMNLPAAFHANFDMNVYKSFFYVSYNASVPLHFKKGMTQVRGFFIQTVTPRIEKQNWSIMLPISHFGNGKMSVGFAGRVNFVGFSVFAGSNNLAWLYGQKASLSRNFFAGVAYSIFYKVPKDTDGDKISDEKDDCPLDPGLAEFRGCPDTDGDGIIDKEDLCIYDKGPRKTKGCPDTDGDGIIDMNDMCPNEKGLGIHYGCPDRDMDGVIDAADRCPDEPGMELNNGCPMKVQVCCLDQDGDGILDAVDKCPTVPGSVYNSGCPIDSSNINKINLQKEKDLKDANNTKQQVKDNPTIDIRDQLLTSKNELDSVLANKMIIKDLSVYFDVDEATLKESERLKLDNLFSKLPSNERYEIVLIGYTDRDGSLDYNLLLSKRRAETIQRKLIDFYKFKGENITVYYYGETKSIHSGDYTDELKQADRRVDLKLIKLPKNP